MRKKRGRFALGFRTPSEPASLAAAAADPTQHGTAAAGAASESEPEAAEENRAAKQSAASSATPLELAAVAPDGTTGSSAASTTRSSTATTAAVSQAETGTVDDDEQDNESTDTVAAFLRTQPGTRKSSPRASGAVPLGHGGSRRGSSAAAARSSKETRGSSKDAAEWTMPSVSVSSVASDKSGSGSAHTASTAVKAAVATAEAVSSEGDANGLRRPRTSVGSAPAAPSRNAAAANWQRRVHADAVRFLKGITLGNTATEARPHGLVETAALTHLRVTPESGHGVLVSDATQRHPEGATQAGVGLVQHAASLAVPGAPGSASPVMRPRAGSNGAARHAIVQVAGLEAVPPGDLGRCRLALAVPDGMPFAVVSMLPYTDTRRKRLFARDATDNARNALKSPKHTTSYEADLYAEPDKHDPDALDDRALHHGKHQKTVALPSYVMTVTLYVTPAELKIELNQQFRDRHPRIQLTLTKLRSLKSDMIDIGYRTCDFNISTVALAQLCFERLVLAEIVTKPTRKILPACCLLLAYKFNNTSRHSVIKERIKDILKAMDDRWRVSPREVLESEFAVYALLKFQILADLNDLDPYLRRVQQAVEA